MVESQTWNRVGSPGSSLGWTQLFQLPEDRPRVGGGGALKVGDLVHNFVLFLVLPAGGSTPWTSLPCKQSPGWTTEKQENGLPAAVCNVSICGEDCLHSISTPFALNRQ